MQAIGTIIDRTRMEYAGGNGNGRGPTTAPVPGPAADPYDDVRGMRLWRLDDLDTGHHPLVATAVAAARTWARRYNEGADPAPWLVLGGPNGTGKSHIARAIWSAFFYTPDYPAGPLGGELRVRLPRGRFLAAADLMAGLDPRREDGHALDNVPVSLVVGSAPIVVIDDVGAEGVLAFVGKEHQSYEREVRYFRFIDFCYANGIPGVITTNLSPGELATHIGRRAWDRLMQMAPYGQTVFLEGVPSWRVKAGGR